MSANFTQSLFDSGLASAPLEPAEAALMKSMLTLSGLDGSSPDGVAIDGLNARDAMAVASSTQSSQVGDILAASQMDGTRFTITGGTISLIHPSEECAQGLHSWINEVGKLSADTPCTRCREPYGDPD